MKPRPLIILLLLTMFVSCEDFFEKDLSGSELLLLSPPDNYATSESDIIFWWDYLNGAFDYQVQIACPDFNQPEKLILDTILIENKFEVKLDTGSYQWRVRGMNGSSVTSFSTRNIVINNSSD